jgi:NADH-quinone oxidoreductase subunit K
MHPAAATRRGTLIPLTYYLVCAAGLYAISAYCLIAKRNMIRLLLALEIMMNATNLLLIAFSSYGAPGLTDPLAHAFTLLSIGIGGCLIAVGLSLILHAYRHYQTLDVRALRRLRH